MDNLIKIIINTIFTFFGGKIREYRKPIVSVSAVIIGVWEWIGGNGLYDILCDVGLQFMCDFQSTDVYAVLLTFVGIISLIIDKIDGTDNLTIGGYTFPIWLDYIVYTAFIVLLGALIFTGAWTILVPVLVVIFFINAFLWIVIKK